ncbi:MAG: hypothetical protein QG567_2034 [Campylobacterota bacterium]|nr:hypothetical protein [Campylobacterota bacterium]
MRLAPLVFVFLVSLVFAQEEEKRKIDVLIEKISTKKNIEINTNIKNPFVQIERFVKPLSVVKKKEEVALEVTGVINKKAIINGKLYRAGDEISGNVIQTITEEGVTFMKDGKAFMKKFTKEDDISIKRDK